MFSVICIFYFRIDVGLNNEDLRNDALKCNVRSFFFFFPFSVIDLFHFDSELFMMIYDIDQKGRGEQDYGNSVTSKKTSGNVNVLNWWQTRPHVKMKERRRVRVASSWASDVSCSHERYRIVAQLIIGTCLLTHFHSYDTDIRFSPDSVPVVITLVLFFKGLWPLLVINELT